MIYTAHTHKKKTQQNILNKTSMTHPNRSRCGLGNPPTDSLFPECLLRYNYTLGEPIMSNTRSGHS